MPGNQIAFHMQRDGNFFTVQTTTRISKQDTSLQDEMQYTFYNFMYL